MTESTAGASLWIAAPLPGRPAAGTLLLGLPLVRRAVLAGQRAGFERILVEEGSCGLDALVAETAAVVVRRAGPPPKLPAGRLVVLSGGTLPQVAWLRALAAAPVECGRILADGSAAAALDLAEDDPAVAALLSRPDSASPIELLSSVRPPSERAVPARRGRFELPPADPRSAERWLLSALVKENEGFMSRHVERRISLAVSRRLAGTSVTPNTMTLVSVGIGLAGAAFFLSTRPSMEFAGSLLFLLHSILDGCDGELARLKFAESRLGGLLDFWGDNVVHSAIFAAIGFAWHRASAEAWPIVASVAAVAGTLLSAAFVYRTTMSGPREGPLFTNATVGPPTALSRVADALARRDFIYLVVLLSAFGKAHWFLTAAAIGAPLYLAVVAGLAARNLGRSFS